MSTSPGQPLMRLAARLWRGLAGGVQWRLLHLREATFMVGLAVVCLDEHDHVLICRHRFHPAHQEWALPGGYLGRRETLTAAISRELREEVGLAGIEDVRLLDQRSGYQLRLELYLTCRVSGSPALTPDGREVVEAAFVPLAVAAQRLSRQHRLMVDQALDSA